MLLSELEHLVLVPVLRLGPLQGRSSRLCRQALR